MKTELPYPTKARLAVADHIEKGFIRWYNFVTPQAFHTVTGFKYTAALDELVKAGIATVPPCAEGSSSVARLTDLAAGWRSGSTSPEPERLAGAGAEGDLGIAGFPGARTARGRCVMPTKAIEEEYWTLQYQTEVLGYREPRFWPPDGEGKYDSAERAASHAAIQVEAGRYRVMRVLHVTRRVEYGEPVLRDPEGGAE